MKGDIEAAIIGRVRTERSWRPCRQGSHGLR